MSKAIETEGALKPIAPYSQGIDAGRLIFVSGQLGVDLATGRIPDDVETETRNLMSAIEAVVGAAGLTMKDVVKTTIFVTSFDDYGVINEVYGEFFSEPHPARSTVKVAGLLLDARVEIEAIALSRE
jgi:2-iminobutanoate/2-iminopropanoate deaminase